MSGQRVGEIVGSRTDLDVRQGVDLEAGVGSNSQPPRRKCRLMPLGATVPADRLGHRRPEAGMPSPPDTEYVMPIESSVARLGASRLARADAPRLRQRRVERPRGVGAWRPAARRSPRTTRPPSVSVLAAGLGGLVVGVGATLGVSRARG